MHCSPLSKWQSVERKREQNGRKTLELFLDKSFAMVEINDAEKTHFY